MPYNNLKIIEEETIQHLPQFIQDLGLLLMVAGVVTLLFKKIGQPVVLGYLLAGFLVGPEVSILPTIQDKQSIQVWAELGVIVLLFGLGLEFSFKKLFAVGRGAVVTAVVEVLVMLGVGYGVGQLLGWNPMDSLFLGGILSISSTTIIIRAFEEMGLKQKGFVQLVFGVLIVEDLVAVLLLVLLSTIAVTQTFAGTELLKSSVQLVFFLSMWFVIGLFLIPLFLEKTRIWLNEETTLIVSLALCLLMVMLATQAGFSPALGAFVMGSILAETKESEKIEHVLKPIKDLFSAVFFVSVGMLIQIEPLKEMGWIVAMIPVITILGKFLSSFAGAILGGQSVKTSVQAGLSLAQIGEFSFIIATLGLSLNVVSEFLYPLAVATSAVTTLTTPYLIRHSEDVYQWLRNRLPKKLNTKEIQSEVALKTPEKSNELISLFLNSMIIVAITLVVQNVVQDYLIRKLENENLIKAACLIISLFASLPFFGALFKQSFNGHHFQEIGFEDLKSLTTRAFLSLVARGVIAFILIVFMAIQFISAFWAILGVVLFSVALGYIGADNFSKIYAWFENRFLTNINVKELSPSRIPDILSHWDAHISKVTVSPNSNMVGFQIAKLEVRKKYGIIIAMIERGGYSILAPEGHQILMPMDQLLILGTDDQLTYFVKDLNVEKETQVHLKMSDYLVQDFLIHREHLWNHKTISEIGIRQTLGGLVIAVEHSGQRYLNPPPDYQFKENDRIWIIGEKIKLDHQLEIQT